MSTVDFFFDEILSKTFKAETVTEGDNRKENTIVKRASRYGRDFGSFLARLKSSYENKERQSPPIHLSRHNIILFFNFY